MQYVNLGPTGLKVSRICLGMMTYGSTKWRPWVLEEEASHPFVRRAVEAGINFFDTANMYSNGVSEKITGKLMQYMYVSSTMGPAFPVDLSALDAAANAGKAASQAPAAAAPAPAQ